MAGSLALSQVSSFNTLGGVRHLLDLVGSNLQVGSNLLLALLGSFLVMSTLFVLERWYQVLL